jgi:hypothetical protein
MAGKEDFDALEWQTVVEGPALAGLMVLTAQRGGAIRESFAIAKAYAEALKEHQGHDLLGEIVEKAPQIAPKEFASAQELRDQAGERIRNAVATLEGRATPEELEAYKRFTLTAAERASEADKSGGVLGVGGERVSEAESAALDEIAAALGIERTSGTGA